MELNTFLSQVPSPGLREIPTYSTKRKIALVALSLAFFPIAQAINILCFPIFCGYGVVSAYKLFKGNAEKWNEKHRNFIAVSTPLVGGVYVSLIVGQSFVSSVFLDAINSIWSGKPRGIYKS